jgi:integrase
MSIRDLRAVDEATLETYRGRLYLAQLSESTRLTRGQSAPRKFFRWLVRRGHVSADPTKDLEPMKVRFMERISVLTRAEVSRLIFRCPPSPPLVRGRREPQKFFAQRAALHNLVELRDRALLSMLFDFFLRGGEPALLEQTHYDDSGRNRHRGREVAVRAGRGPVARKHESRDGALPRSSPAVTLGRTSCPVSPAHGSPARYETLELCRLREIDLPANRVRRDHLPIHRVVKDLRDEPPDATDVVRRVPFPLHARDESGVARLRVATPTSRIDRRAILPGYGPTTKDLKSGDTIRGIVPESLPTKETRQPRRNIPGRK